MRVRQVTKFPSIILHKNQTSTTVVLVAAAAVVHFTEETLTAPDFLLHMYSIANRFSENPSFGTSGRQTHDTASHPRRPESPSNTAGRTLNLTTYLCIIIIIIIIIIIFVKALKV